MALPCPNSIPIWRVSAGPLEEFARLIWLNKVIKLVAPKFIKLRMIFAVILLLLNFKFVYPYATFPPMPSVPEMMSSYYGGDTKPSMAVVQEQKDMEMVIRIADNSPHLIFR